MAIEIGQLYSVKKFFLLIGQNKKTFVFLLIFSILFFISILFTIKPIYESKSVIKIAEVSELNRIIDKFSITDVVWSIQTFESPVSKAVIGSLKSKGFLLTIFDRFKDNNLLFGDSNKFDESSDLSMDLQKAKREELALKKIEEFLTISVKLNYLEISVKTENADLSETVLYFVLDNLKKYIREKNIKILKEYIDEYKIKMNETSNPFIIKHYLNLISKKIQKTFTLSTRFYDVEAYPFSPFIETTPKIGFFSVLITLLCLFGSVMLICLMNKKDIEV